MKDLNPGELNNALSRAVSKMLVQSLLAGLSIEITAKEASRISDFRELLPNGTEVYIVATPNTRADVVINLAIRLYQEGMTPVPHLAARGVSSVDDLNQWLKILNMKANVDRVLVVAGGHHNKSAGPFSSSLDLVNSHILAKNGINDIRFAGHPEGHPLVSDSRLFEILLEKQKAGEKHGFKTSLVTQFFFDFDPVAQWERNLVSLGINMPIRVGFHGVVGISSLIRHGMYCGVGASLNQFMKNPARFVNAATIASPEKLLLGLARHCQNYPHTLFAECHFFPFGNFEQTAKWLKTIYSCNIKS